MKDQRYISKIKNIFTFSIVFLFFTFSFLISSLRFVSAQEIIPSAADSSNVNYQLAYPGLLPDHPLYFVKAARDRIGAFFISNPLKKSEFDLLQADKRIASSLLLVQKGQGKIPLAKSTFSKGENYFEDALNRASDAKSQGMNIAEISKKLKDANLKHKEVLNDIEKKLNKKDKNKFGVERLRIIDLEKRANGLVSKK